MEAAQFQMTCPKCGSYSFTVRRDQRAYVHKSQPFELVFSCRCGKQLFGDQIQEEYDRQKAIWEQERQAGADLDNEAQERLREEERRKEQLRRAMEYRRTYLAEKRRKQAEEERLRKEEEDRRWREKVARVEAEERGEPVPAIAPRSIPTRPASRRSEPRAPEPRRAARTEPAPAPQPVSAGANAAASAVEPRREPARAPEPVRRPPAEPAAPRAHAHENGVASPAAAPTPARTASAPRAGAEAPAPAPAPAARATPAADPSLADPEHPHAEFMPYVLDGTFAELFPDAVPPDRKDHALCVWPPCEKTRRKKSKYCSRECSNKNARWRHKMRRKEDGEED